MPKRIGYQRKVRPCMARQMGLSRAAWLRLERACHGSPVSIADLHRLLGAFERTTEGGAWMTAARTWAKLPPR